MYREDGRPARPEAARVISPTGVFRVPPSRLQVAWKGAIVLPDTLESSAQC
jgi:hypothetical protein